MMNNLSILIQPALLLRWTIFLTWVIWFIAYWGGPSGMIKEWQANRHATERRDRLLSTWLGVITIFPLILHLVTGPADNHQLILIVSGLILILAGLVMTGRARRHLAHHWTSALKQPDEIIQSGPYRLVRHPIYSATLILYLGIALTYMSFLSGAWVVNALAAFAIKARREEQVLTNQQPDYPHYCQQVRYRLIPGLW